MTYSSQGSHTGQLDFCNWQYDGIMWLALRSVKSNNVDNIIIIIVIIIIIIIIIKYTGYYQIHGLMENNFYIFFMFMW